MRHNVLFRCLLVASILCSVKVDSAIAQQPREAWVQRWSFPANTAWDQAVRIATDNAGNVIVLGNSDEGTTASDIVLIKYSGAGTALWTNRYNAPGESTDEATGLALGSEGQVFVTGSSYLREHGSSDYVTLAYSTAGVPLWTNRYDGLIHSNDVPKAIAVDADDNVFVTGSSFEGGGAFITTVKYSPQGTPLWIRQYNRQPDDQAGATALAVAENGNVVVAGWAALLPGKLLCVTIQYAGNGETLWTNFFEGFGSDPIFPKAVAIDSKGDLVVIGSSSPNLGWSIKYESSGRPLWTNSLSGTPKVMAIDQSDNIFIGGNSSAGYERTDFLTLGYSSTGLLLWTNSHHGSCPVYCYDGVEAIAVNECGNVVVTGRTTDSNTHLDYGTICYSGSGIPLWTNTFAGSNRDDVVSSVAMDPDGGAFVTGTSDNDIVTVAYSAVGLPCWTNRYAGVGNEPDTVSGLAVGTDGSVVVTGTSRTPEPGKSNESFATIAYSSEGVPSWTNFFDDPFNLCNRSVGIGISSNGNVVVMGLSSINNAEAHFTTIAYTKEGIPVWTNTYSSRANGFDKPSAMAINGTGTVFVTGSSVGSNGFADFVTIAYAENGTPLWTNRLHRYYDDVPEAIAVGSNGNVFVTGRSYSPDSGYNDYLTIAYSDKGLPIWTNLYQGGSGGDDCPTDIAVDNAGRVIVTGYSERRLNFCDFATVAYSSNGAPLWTNRFGSVLDHTVGHQDNGSIAQAVAVDDNGNVFVTGFSYRQEGENPDYVTVSYSSSGTPRWTNYYNGPGNNYDIAGAVIVDSRGHVIVTGISDSGGFNYDFATLFYSNEGTPFSTNRYDGPMKGDEDNSGIALGSDGSVFVADSSEGAYRGSTYDFAVVKYGVPPGFLCENTNQIALVGSQAEFYVTAYGTGPLAYQWLFNGRILNDETNEVLQIPNVMAWDEGEYSVLVSNPYGTVMSSTTLKTFVPPQFQSIKMLPDGTTQLLLVGTPCFRYGIESSANLLDWIAEEDIVSSNSVYSFIDSTPTGDRQRFYRAVCPLHPP